MHSIAVIFYDGKKNLRGRMQEHSAVLLLAMLRTAEVPFKRTNSHAKLSREPESSSKVSDIHLRSKRKKKVKKDKTLDTLDSFTCLHVVLSADRIKIDSQSVIC